MTEEQKKARKESAENGHIREIKEHYLRTMDDGDDYVFISYKSDDYKQVLDDIVYNTCKKYGLRVYFDTAFDEGSDSWIKQYRKNMNSIHCKAFIAFIDDAYYSSYACLMEMMARKTLMAGGDCNWDSLPFLPINIGSLSDILSDANTGLGTRRFANGKLNGHAEEELEVFNEIFREVSAFHLKLKFIYTCGKEKPLKLYEEATSESPAYGEKYLTITQCRKIMETIIPENIDNDGTNKDFVEVIHDKLINKGITTVFEQTDEINQVTFVDGEKKTTCRIKEGELVPKPDVEKKEGFVFKGWFVEGTEKAWDFASDAVTQDITLTARYEKIVISPEVKTISLKAFLKAYSNANFKKSTYRKFRLIGQGDASRFNTDFYESAFDLVWDFVMKLLSERGESFIDEVNSAHAENKNPAFINSECYAKRDDQKKYRQIAIDSLNDYYMYRHYSQYDWIAVVLKQRIQEFGLDINDFSFEFILGDETIIDDGGVLPPEDVFVYELWEIVYTAPKMVDMLHDVFDRIAEIYPEQIPNIAKAGKVTAVARKADLEQKTANESKIKQFLHYGSREHIVNGEVYCVNAGYNLETCVKQIEKMLSLCDEEPNIFKIINKPVRTKNGKKGLGEIL